MEFRETTGESDLSVRESNGPAPAVSLRLSLRRIDSFTACNFSIKLDVGEDVKTALVLLSEAGECDLVHCLFVFPILLSKCIFL